MYLDSALTNNNYLDLLSSQEYLLAIFCTYTWVKQVQISNRSTKNMTCGTITFRVTGDYVQKKNAIIPLMFTLLKCPFFHLCLLPEAQ